MKFRYFPALALLFAAMPAAALESPPVSTERSTVTLVSAADAVEAGQPTRLGLRFRLAPGWHIYWTNPGEAGQAPDLTLTLPPGAKAGGIEWPTPARLMEGPVMTYAYTGEVLLPFKVTPAGAIAVDASVTWLICQKICIPEEGKFHLDLPAGPASPSAQAPLFAVADARMPQPSPFAAHIAPDGVLSLEGAGLSRKTVADAWFFPTASDAIAAAAPQTLAVHDGGLQLTLKLLPKFDVTAGLVGVLVLKDPNDGESALQVSATPGAARAASLGWARMLLFALLGGLILNLMPCVFPVLAMKAMALARLSGSERGRVRAHAASYTLGVLVSFAALGGILIALRATGDAVGWGFQFQSPVFVAAMAWLLFAVGLELSGVFMVGGSVMGAGQGLTSQGGHAGSFFTGLLAVLVATPCTAPFMGVALAAALAAPAWVTIAVFLTMGLGLAAPYGVLALAPGLARMLPRPGAWMDVLKQALAFPMYAASAWLIWVISQEAGSGGVMVGVAGLVLLGFAAWAHGASQASPGTGARRVGQAAALIATIAALALLPGIVPATGEAVATEGDAEPYSAARLAALHAEGRPVFVNMTAAWCVTCLVNERVALSPQAVRAGFAAHHVAYLKGDWTRQDPAITAFLRQYDRDGVPLYVLYPAGDAAPVVLPQILTANTILDRLNSVTVH